MQEQLLDTGKATPPGQWQWSSFQKTCFRFFFIYLAITSWYSYNVIGIVFGYQYDKWGRWINKISAPFAWLDKHVYHLGYYPVKNGYVSLSDGKLGWIIMATSVVVSGVGGIVWGIADRKRANYDKLHYWFRTYLAYYLFIATINYAMEKIIPLQMPYPNAQSLLEPLGNKSRFTVLWDFIGSSPAYSTFTGVSELIAIILVLNRRTRIFGCFVLSGILLNVVCLDFFYNVNVKLLSSHLFIVTLFMLAPNVPKLIRFFYFQQPVSLAEKQYRFTTPWKKHLLFSLLLAPICVTYQSLAESIGRMGNNKLLQQQKVYNAVVFAKGADTLPPLLTDTFRIKKLAFTSYKGKKFALAYAMNDAAVKYDYVWDSLGANITLIKFGDTIKTGVFAYKMPVGNELVLTGTWKGQPVSIKCREFDITGMQLVKEKISWVR